MAAELSAANTASRQSAVTTAGSLTFGSPSMPRSASLARSPGGLNPFPQPTIRAAMSGEPDNLVLVYLRRLDEKVDHLLDDVQDLKHRVTSLEARVAALQ
jgi:hypothetical protein